MKKLLKLAAVLAALSLMFGLASCSDSDDDDDTPTSQPGGDNGGSGNEGDGDKYTGEPTTDSWDFTTYGDAVWVNPDAAGSTVQKDATKYTQDGTYTLSADATVKGASDVLTLTVTKDGTGKGASQNTVNYSYQAGTTDGLRLKSDALKIEWSCIKNKAANDRKLEVTVGDDGTPVEIGNTATTGATSENVAMTPYETEINAGNGTNIYIGASNNIFIKTITITKQATEFNTDTNGDTANDLATLGLVGTTATSSNESIATATIADGKIKITSVKAGTATVTVKNAAGKEATIAVTVKSSGEIELGTVTKFSREAPKLVDGSKTNANSSNGTKGGAKATWDGLTDLQYSTDGTNFVDKETAGITATVEGTTVTVTGLDAGTYYVRGAKSNEYEATPALTITIRDESVAVTSYTLDMAKAAFTITVEKNANNPTEGYAEIDGMKFEVSGNKNKDLPDTQKTVKVANMGGAVAKDKNYIKFTTTKTSSVTVRFFCNNADRSVKIMNSDGSVTKTGEEKTTAVSSNITDPDTDENVKETTFTSLPADTYYLGSSSSGNYITKVVVTAE